MHEKKWMKLIDTLLLHTTTGVRKWEIGFGSVPQTQIAGNFVAISEKKNAEGQLLYEVDIHNSDMDRVDGFSDEDLQDAFSSENYYLKMQNLYRSALRSATNADQVLDNILKELDDEIPF